MVDPLEIVERQNQIIQIQSGVIDELFILLMQHISVADVDKFPVVAKISHAAQIRLEIE